MHTAFSGAAFEDFFFVIKQFGFVATALAAGPAAVGGVCDDNVDVLGVQVPVHDVAQGIDVPVLSPGAHEAGGSSPSNCASGAIADGGTAQGR